MTALSAIISVFIITKLEANSFRSVVLDYDTYLMTSLVLCSYLI